MESPRFINHVYGTDLGGGSVVWSYTWIRNWSDVWSSENLERWHAPFRPGSTALATPFMHPHFARAWLDAVGGEAAFDPYFLNAAHPDGRRAQWLLVVARPRWRGGVRSLVPVGSPVLDYGQRSKLAAYYEPVLTGPTLPIDPAGFWEGLLSAVDQMTGSDIDSFAVSRFRVQAINAPEAALPCSVAPYLRLLPYADPEAYLAARRARVRSSIRRRLRNFRKAGHGAFRVHGSDDLDGALACLGRLDEGRAQRYGSRTLEGFLPSIARLGVESGLTHVSSLELDGRSISWMHGYVVQGVYYGYYRAFDPDFERLSPGVVHFFRLLEWCFENDIETIDFGIGASPYKFEWTDGDSWEIRSLTVKGVALESLARRSAAATVRRTRELAQRLSLASPLPARRQS